MRMVQHLGLGIVALAPGLFKEPWHTSALSGHAWVRELIQGHPLRMLYTLGVSQEVFSSLVMELRSLCSYRDSRYISLEEQVAIFLYSCATGLSIRQIGERFQHAGETISK